MIGLLPYSARGTGFGSLLQRASVALLLAVLVWAPLPAGSNRPWSKEIIVLLSMGTVALGSLGLMLQGCRVLLPKRVRAAGVLLAGVIVWAWLQGSPLLPAGWAHPAWGWLAGTGLAADPSVSVDPTATEAALLLLVSYCLLFGFAFALGQQTQLASGLAVGLVGIACGWAIWGLARFLGGFDLLFYAGMPTTPGVTGNFPNRSHFATYVNLAFLIVLARLCSPLLHPAEADGFARGFKRRVGDAISYLFEHRQLWVLAGALLLIASLGSTSRGGFLSLIAAVLVLLALIVRRVAVGMLQGGLALAVALALVIALVPVVGSALLERLSLLDIDYVRNDIARPGRLAAWEIALALIGQRPLLGHGYGAFASAFLVQADERFTVFYEYAHNIFLESAVELGLPASVALYLAFGLLASLCLKRDRHGQAHSLPLAAAAGSVLVALHGLVDFSIQIPAVALSYAVILGLACGQATAYAAPRRRAAEPNRAAVEQPGRELQAARRWSKAGA